MYVICGPTHNAVFEGSVQGVVVHANRHTGRASGFANRWSVLSVTRNCAVTVVSFTSR